MLGKRKVDNDRSTLIQEITEAKDRSPYSRCKPATMGTTLQTGKSTKTIAVRGQGFLRSSSHRDTLLYHQGFARPITDVLKKVPEVLHDYQQRLIDRWADVKSLGIRGLVPITDKGKRQIATSDVLPAVIQATSSSLHWSSSDCC